MIKNAILIEVKKCIRATSYNNGRQEPKVDKSGAPVYSLFYTEVTHNKELDIEETQVKKINSLIELEPGSYLLEVQLFSINNNIFYKVVGNLKSIIKINK